MVVYRRFRGWMGMLGGRHSQISKKKQSKPTTKSVHVAAFEENSTLPETNIAPEN